MAEVETKVTWSAIGALGAGFAGALLNLLVGDSELLGGLPAWLQFVIVLLAPSVAAWLAGYAKPSPTSSVSVGTTK
jgi:hypothetical protein